MNITKNYVFNSRAGKIISESVIESIIPPFPIM